MQLDTPRFRCHLEQFGPGGSEVVSADLKESHFYNLIEHLPDHFTFRVGRWNRPMVIA
jgi:hypothetical protein